MKLSGSLGALFGVCANEWSPDDGRVVAFDHGCGAHSETDQPKRRAQWPVVPPRVDDLSMEQVVLEVPDSDQEPEEGSVPEEEKPELEPVGEPGEG